MQTEEMHTTHAKKHIQRKLKRSLFKVVPIQVLGQIAKWPHPVSRMRGNRLSEQNSCHQHSQPNSLLMFCSTADFLCGLIVKDAEWTHPVS